MFCRTGFLLLNTNIICNKVHSGSLDESSEIPSAVVGLFKMYSKQLINMHFNSHFNCTCGHKIWMGI